MAARGAREGLPGCAAPLYVLTTKPGVPRQAKGRALVRKIKTTKVGGSKRRKEPRTRRPVTIRSIILPNQVLTHAARAAATQLNKVPFQALLVAARGAREGLWSE